MAVKFVQGMQQSCLFCTNHVVKKEQPGVPTLLQHFPSCLCPSHTLLLYPLFDVASWHSHSPPAECYPPPPPRAPLLFMLQPFSLCDTSDLLLDLRGSLGPSVPPHSLTRTQAREHTNCTQASCLLRGPPLEADCYICPCLTSALWPK